MVHRYIYKKSKFWSIILLYVVCSKLIKLVVACSKFDFCAIEKLTTKLTSAYYKLVVSLMRFVISFQSRKKMASAQPVGERKTLVLWWESCGLNKNWSWKSETWQIILYMFENLAKPKCDLLGKKNVIRCFFLVKKRGH